MPLSKFSSALHSVDWKRNIETLLADTKSAQKLVDANLRLAIWAKQFERIEQGNPAISFVREMQMAGQHSAVLIALSLYKPAAGSIRAMLETALYYSFFRIHPAELETQARSNGFYIEKREVLEFHKTHTLRYGELQQKLGINSRLEAWYGQVSSLVHGHIPGAWVEHKSVAEIKPIKSTQDIAIGVFVEGEEIIHRFFLCTVGKHLWESFSSAAKGKLLSGLHGDYKKLLELDGA